MNETPDTAQRPAQPVVATGPWLGRFASAIAFVGSMWAGVYLCIHDFPVLVGWICILSLLGTWGFEKANP